MDLSCAPTGEHRAGVSCGGGGGSGEGLAGRRAQGQRQHRGWCHKGEPWGSGLPCLQKRPEMGISEQEAPNALLEGRGSEWERSGLHLLLSTLLHACPEAFLNDETECVFLGHSKPAFSEQTESKKTLSQVQSTSTDPQITLGLLALPALEGANPVCHS